MGEENRGSSGSGTVMIVVAILGGILLVGCCGGVIALGLGSVMWVRTTPMEVQMQPPLPPIRVETQLDPPMSVEDVSKELETQRSEPESVISPDSSVPAVEPPPAEAAPAEKKE
jgi:hypothetical protein